MYTLSYDTKIEQSTPGFFTINGSANTRYGGATYNGKTYATGLKFDSKASIKFTSIAKSTLTIVQSLAPTDKNYDNDFKLDGKNLGKDSMCSFPTTERFLNTSRMSSANGTSASRKAITQKSLSSTQTRS